MNGLAERLITTFADLLEAHLDALRVRPGSVVSLSVENADGALPPESYLPEIIIRVRDADGQTRYLDLNDFGEMIWSGSTGQGGPLDEVAAALDAEGEATGNRDPHQRAVMEDLTVRIEQRLRARQLAAPDFRKRTVIFD